MQILVLGPLEVRRAGAAVHVGGPHLRAVLAALVLSANHAVPLDRLVWVVWGDTPPPGADATVQSYISRLRHALGAESIHTVDHCYLLVAGCEQIDACRFERLVHQACNHLESEPERAVDESRKAIALWRGPVLGELGDEEFAHLEAIRLEELRLLAVEIETESELLLGRFGESASRLRALVVEYPHRERFWRLLIRALSADNRRFEARDAFREYQAWLADSGLEPDISFEELTGGQRSPVDCQPPETHE